jgi:hypothetical protein
MSPGICTHIFVASCFVLKHKRAPSTILKDAHAVFLSSYLDSPLFSVTKAVGKRWIGAQKTKAKCVGLFQVHSLFDINKCISENRLLVIFQTS